MTRVTFAAIFTLIAISSAGTVSAQAPAQSPAPAPRSRAVNPANEGRLQLEQYLDGFATQDEAARAITVAAIHTRAQALARQAHVRAQILSLIGALPQRTPLNARTLGETQADGFRIRKVIFESQPNFFVTALLYVPDGAPAGGKRSAIIMSPGHAPSGKAGDAPVAAIFARNGFIVLSYDPIGQGERIQLLDDNKKPGIQGSTNEHTMIGVGALLVVVAAVCVWIARPRAVSGTGPASLPAFGGRSFAELDHQCAEEDRIISSFTAVRDAQQQRESEQRDHSIELHKRLVSALPSHDADEMPDRTIERAEAYLAGCDGFRALTQARAELEQRQGCPDHLTGK